MSIHVAQNCYKSYRKGKLLGHFKLQNHYCINLTGMPYLSGTIVLKKVGNSTDSEAMKVFGSAPNTPSDSYQDRSSWMFQLQEKSVLYYPVPKLCHETVGHLYRIPKGKNKQRVRSSCHPYSQQKKKFKISFLKHNLKRPVIHKHFRTSVLNVLE